MDITYFESGYIDNTYFVYTADSGASCYLWTSTLTASINVRGIQSAEAHLSTSSTLAVEFTPVSRWIDPYIISGANYSGIGYDSTVKKFGTSLRFDARGEGGKVDLGPVYGNGIFLALNQPSPELGTAWSFTSTNGLTWTTTENNLPKGNQHYVNTTFVSLHFLNNQFIVQIQDTSYRTHLYTSSNGITWTDHNTSQNYNFTSITYINSTYIAVNSSNNVYTSTNLTTWSTPYTYYPSAYLPVHLNSVNCQVDQYGNTITVLSGYSQILDNSNREKSHTPFVLYTTTWPLSFRDNQWYPYAIGTSNSSSNFTDSTAQINQKFLSSTYDGTNLVFGGTNGNVYSSPMSGFSGRSPTFTKRTTNTTKDISQLSYNNNYYTAQLTQATNYVLVGTSLTNWSELQINLSTPTTLVPWVDGTIPIEGNTFTNGVAYGAGTWIVNGLYNTNPGTNNWQYIDFIGQLPNQPASVYYEPGTYLNLWKTLDFWLYIDTPAQQVYGMNMGILYQNDINNQGGFAIIANIEPPNGYQIQLGGYDSTGATDILFYSNLVNFNSWNHFRIVHDGTNGALFANGQRNGTIFSEGSGTLNFLNSPMYLGRWFGDVASPAPRLYLDEFLLTRELLSQPNDTTYTVPTTPWGNGRNVTALFHFDNSIEDDNSYWVQVDMVSHSTMRTVAGRLVGAQAQLSCSSTVQTQIIRVKQFIEPMSSTFVMTTNAAKIVKASSILRSTSQLIANDIETIRVTANLSSTSSIRSIIGKRTGIIANLSTRSTLSANVSRVKFVSAGLSSTSSINCTGSRTHLVTINTALSTTTTFTSSAIKTAGSIGHFNSLFTLRGSLNSFGTVKQAVGHFNSQFRFTAYGGTKHIDTSLVWYVPFDQRDWMIEYEARDWIIPKEHN